MSEAYSGNLKISKLVIKIHAEMERLKEGNLNKRTMRQILDADNFLRMLKTPPYCQATTVGELKRIIKQRRSELVDELGACGVYLIGYQFTFEDIGRKEPTENEQKEMEITKRNLEKENKWLHKCLGVCCNADYFL